MILLEKLGVEEDKIEHFIGTHCVLDFQDLKGHFDDESLENICGKIDVIEEKCKKCWNLNYIENTDNDMNTPYPTLPDNVNHPSHYQGKHECIDVMRSMFGDEAVKGFCKCNAYKYRFRAAMKNGDEDIKKAEWYEDYLIKMES